MENFNGSLNGEEQEKTSIAIGILGAFLGMLIGIIPYIITGGLMEWRSWGVVGGASVGFCVSLGWQIGKGPMGATRHIIMIIFSIIGAFATMILGYALFYYRQLFVGFDIDRFIWVVEGTIEIFFDGLGSIFSEPVTLDGLVAIVLAIAVSWKKLNLDADTDLEELENDDLESLDTTVNSVILNDTVAQNNDSYDVNSYDDNSSNESYNDNSYSDTSSYSDSGSYSD